VTTVDPYAFGALNAEHHARLVADLENYARDAGIQPHWIYHPLPDDVTAAERNYLRHFRKHLAGESSGLCYTAKAGIDSIDQRMSAIAGCLVRNFIRARVMTVGAVLDALASSSLPNLTCILIPNFFIPAADGGHLAKWQISALYDMLISRQLSGQQTVIYATDLSLLGKEYGAPMKKLIEQFFVKVGG